MTKYLVCLIHKLLGRRRKLLLLALLLILVATPIVLATVWADKLLDTDPDRGATTVAGADVFGDKFDKVIYPKDQGWNEADSLWFYNTTQGSNLLPYDFFLVLENATSTTPFRDNAHISSLRYLPQKPTRSNPDGLPVGFVKDKYLDKQFMGFTCAACHTSQVNYNNVGIRIDGAPALADMTGLLKDMVAALDATANSPEKKQRFYKAVLALGHYKSEKEIDADLNLYAQRLKVYNFINHSNTEYGYARLDAFGRIYNRVLQYIVTEDDINKFMTRMPCDHSKILCIADEKSAQERFELSLAKADGSRTHIVERALDSLNQPEQEAFRKAFFNPANAPVSYPFLWDIPQHDYVQWNAIAANAGLGPIGRNTGEVIGVFATLDWQKRKFTPFFHNPINATRERIRSLIGGQGFFAENYVDFTSSADAHNLDRLENHLIKLKSPRWEDPTLAEVLPKLDVTKVERGAALFRQHCMACHADIDRDSAQRRVVANMTKLEAIATDKTMAENSVGYQGHSGMIKNLYVGAGPGDILLQEKSPVAAILTKSTLNVVATPDPDTNYFTRFGNWAYTLIRGFFSNEIKASLKFGNYTPDTTASPFASLRAYKGRPLDGIWATAPYLHNGSVPTLYDLLLPVEERPKTFMVGSRELDTVKGGFKSTGYEGFKFDTSLPGNSNSGHDYGSKELSEQDRYDLVEYMKSL